MRFVLLAVLLSSCSRVVVTAEQMDTCKALCPGHPRELLGVLNEGICECKVYQDLTSKTILVSKATLDMCNTYVGLKK